MRHGAISTNCRTTRWAGWQVCENASSAGRWPLCTASRRANGYRDYADSDVAVLQFIRRTRDLGFSLPEDSPLRKAYETELGDPLNAQLDPSEWMALLGKLPLAYQPGDRFHYGHSTDVLGFIVGRIHGKPFADVLKERIFGPLGMNDTDFWIPHEKRDRAAALYMYDGKGLKRLPGVPYDAPPKFAGGGGGLTSTVEDYIKFAKLMIKNGESDGVRLLKPETVTMMRTNRLTDAQRAIPFLGMDFWWKSQGFGLGLSTIMDPAQHILGAGSKGSYGWPGIFGTWWQADPVEDTILIWLVQNSVMLAGPEAAAAAVTGQAATARMAQPMFQRAAYDAIAKGKAQ